MYISGQWVDSESQNLMHVTNPATKELIDTVPHADKVDVEKALQSAHKTKIDWGKTPVWKRSEILQRFSVKVLENKESLASLLSKEAGKPIAQAMGEIQSVSRLFHSFSEHAKSLYGMNIPLDNQSGVENDIYITRKEPLGVIVCIIPFNFPAELFAHKVAPVLATGNVAIVKPPEDDPLTILHLTKLLYEAGLPENVLQVVPGTGQTVGQMLTTSSLVNGISLTGSTASGIKVAENAAKHLSRLKLELGGNDPLIVCEDANLELAVDQTIFGRTWNNGQVCCANKRMLIHETKIKDFTDLLISKLRKIEYGNPLNENIQLGPLIHEKALNTVHQQVQFTKEQGATIALGGEIIDNTYYLPTVLTNVDPTFEVAKDMEIFGPVFPIIPFSTDDEAVSIANSSIYGLNASVFTENINRAVNMGYKIESGTVVINNTGNYRPDYTFFGGYKMSGVGREGLIGALEEATQIKSVVIRNGLSIY
jgi:acyl-CoA reductase-like NAD-dependent aldehyde dehydrogenase